jgi:molybdopterin synthase sulfur carrier subunit
MKVRVKYFTTLRELAGTKEDELDLKDGCRLLELIETVAVRYGDEAFAYLHVADDGRIDPSLKFLVNGVDAHRLAGFETALKAGDVVAIIPPVGGG